MKICIHCGVEKIETEFHRQSSSKDGYKGVCKKCCSDWTKARRKEHPEKFKAWSQTWVKRNPRRRKEINRKSDIKRLYGMSEDFFNSILQKQKGLCAICKDPFNKSPQIDHDHGTGKVRGLLCHKCNKALGLFKESKEVVFRAAEYLENSL